MNPAKTEKLVILGMFLSKIITNQKEQLIFLSNERFSDNYPKSLNFSNEKLDFIPK